MLIENKKVVYTFTISGNKFKVEILNDLIRIFKETSEMTVLITSQIKTMLTGLGFEVWGVTTYTGEGYKTLHQPKKKIVWRLK